MKFILDFLPLIVFFVAYKFSNIVIATWFLMLATAVQIILLKWIYKKIDTMQRYTAYGIFIFGSMTVILQNPIFIIWKPSIIFSIMLLVALFVKYKQKISFTEKLLGEKVPMSQSAWQKIDFIWIAFFALLLVINTWLAVQYLDIHLQVTNLMIDCINQEKHSLCVLQTYYEQKWVYFKTLFIPIASLVFAVIQVVFIYKNTTLNK